MGRQAGKKYIRSWQMEPLAPAYLATLAADRADVRFYDDRLEAIPYDEATDLVGISVETYTARRAYQIATEYRKRGVPVVMGGFHATLLPQEVLQYADAVVVGEAEDVFAGLLDDFRAGRMRRVYRSSERPSLERITPDRRIFAGKRYLKLGLVEVSRGCPHRCGFCAVSSYYGATQNRRGIDSVLAEIEEQRKTRDLIFFVDDNFGAHRKAAKEFMRELAGMNVRWVSQSSFDVTRDPESLELMQASGCKGILVGLETLQADNLAQMSKDFLKTPDLFAEGLRRLEAHRIAVYPTFIFGYDHDTLDGYRRTVDFALEHRLFLGAFNHLLPFPGTPLYHDLQTAGRLTHPRWWIEDGYGYGTLPFASKLPPQVVEEECMKARARFYSLAHIFRRFGNPANRSDSVMARAFWVINLMVRHEGYQRRAMPLGDESLPPPPAFDAPAADAEWAGLQAEAEVPMLQPV